MLVGEKVQTSIFSTGLSKDKPKLGNAKFEETVDKLAQKHQSWRSNMYESDPMCKLAMLYAEPETLNPVLLAGHEGGGVDWARRLLETATGIFCGIDDR